MVALIDRAPLEYPPPASAYLVDCCRLFVLRPSYRFRVPVTAQQADGELHRPHLLSKRPAHKTARSRLVIVYVLGRIPALQCGRVCRHSRTDATFERNSLDQAVNLVPGVVANFDANGRRNESDIFVRGFGRQQVPLMVDGVRIYLPADNRLDFARFLTADVAAIQIQKGYASVLDGPGAMGGTINLVTMKPTKAFEGEGAISAAGRGVEGWNAYAVVGSRQPRYYAQGSVAESDRNSWSLSDEYRPTSNSLQRSGERGSTPRTGAPT
jgi:outer membrane receptor for Fe3+-dicitrate